jgi:RNA polymerase sigma-70 factor (ECF subfamily)
MVQFNKAIAIGFADGPQRGIDALLKMEGLDKSHYYHTALGDFYAKMGDSASAKKHYETAIQFTTSKAEWQLIWQKMELFNTL